MNSFLKGLGEDFLMLQKFEAESKKKLSMQKLNAAGLRVTLFYREGPAM